MHPAKQFFLGLTLRERILLIAFLATMLVLWALVIFRGLQSNIAGLSLAGQQLEDQERQLQRADEVQVRLSEALTTLDSTRTYSATQLVGKIDQVARELGVPRYDLSTATTQDSDIFASHAVRLRIDNGNLNDLLRFNQVLQQENPYIVLTQFQIASRQSDPRLLDASFEISSIELKANIGQ